MIGSVRQLLVFLQKVVGDLLLASSTVYHMIQSYCNIVYMQASHSSSSTSCDQQHKYGVLVQQHTAYDVRCTASSISTHTSYFIPTEHVLFHSKCIVNMRWLLLLRGRTKGRCKKNPLPAKLLFVKRSRLYLRTSHGRDGSASFLLGFQPYYSSHSCRYSNDYFWTNFKSMSDFTTKVCIK